MEDIGLLINEKLKGALSLAKELQQHPELGFSEYESSSILRRYWESLGLEVQGPFAGTGIKARIKGAGKGPTVCLLSELDAVVSPLNPMADAKGNAHACGHNIQSTQVYLAGAVLNNLREKLCGDVVLLAVPAEEFLEIEHRLEMKKDGKIRYLSGKPELYRLGVFDDVDMVIMIHAYPNPDCKLYVGGGSLGFTAKNIRFLGISGHGAAPFDSRNALQAATLFFAGVNANRETFRDEESIRIHPIITKGGEIVNSVPDDVKMPYLTYEVADDNFGNTITLSASLWYRSSSWSEITAKEQEIADFITRGGRMVTFDDGAIWIQMAFPWAQRMSDVSDSMVRRIVLSVAVEFIN